jgi:hypothetical protein
MTSVKAFPKGSKNRRNLMGYSELRVFLMFSIDFAPFPAENWQRMLDFMHRLKDKGQGYACVSQARI